MAGVGSGPGACLEEADRFHKITGHASAFLDTSILNLRTSSGFFRASSSRRFTCFTSLFVSSSFFPNLVCKMHRFLLLPLHLLCKASAFSQPHILLLPLKLFLLLPHLLIHLPRLLTHPPKFALVRNGSIHRDCTSTLYLIGKIYEFDATTTRSLKLEISKSSVGL